MTALILALLALVLLHVAVIAGWTPDSRDGRDWWCRREWPATLTPVSWQPSLMPGLRGSLSRRRDLHEEVRSDDPIMQPRAAPVVPRVFHASAETTSTSVISSTVVVSWPGTGSQDAKERRQVEAGPGQASTTAPTRAISGWRTWGAKPYRQRGDEDPATGARSGSAVTRVSCTRAGRGE